MWNFKIDGYEHKVISTVPSANVFAEWYILVTGEYGSLACKPFVTVIGNDVECACSVRIKNGIIESHMELSIMINDHDEIELWIKNTQEYPLDVIVKNI